jgi:hypothetical protein
MGSMRRRTFLLGVLQSLPALSLRGQDVTLPVKSGSVRFAAIGDMGTGEPAQYEIAQRMLQFHEKFPFTFVMMLGDNIYGGKSPVDLQKKFETPYKPLLDAGVQFYAVLGNHDDTNERFYKFFNMNGQQYYSFKKNNVHFFALDSNYLDPKQRARQHGNNGLEDLLFSSSLILIGSLPRVVDGAADGVGTALRQVWRSGCVRGARTRV